MGRLGSAAVAADGALITAAVVTAAAMDTEVRRDDAVPSVACALPYTTHKAIHERRVGAKGVDGVGAKIGAMQA